MVWVQEEPENQGAWPFLALNLPQLIEGRSLRVIARPASASPAVGIAKVHKAEQDSLIQRAFDRDNT